jgi:hypothetical protein
MSVYGLKTEDNYVIKDEDEYDIIQEQYNFSSQIGDSLEDNEEIESEADNILDFSERDPFSEGAY